MIIYKETVWLGLPGNVSISVPYILGIHSRMGIVQKGLFEELILEKGGTGCDRIGYNLTAMPCSWITPPS